MSEYSLIIDGNKVSAAETFDVISPATGEVAAQCPAATEEHLDLAVAAAKKAFESWSREDIAVRRQLMHAAAGAIEENIEELAYLRHLEQGRPVSDTIGTLGWSVGWCHATAELDLPKEVLKDDDEGRIEVHRKPLGVVGSITPWNFPDLIGIWHIIPAMLAGNTVVIKPSGFTPLSTLKMVEIMNRVLPAGVLNAITGGGHLGRLMSGHRDISKITFTGSIPTGKDIMQNAAGNLKRLTLELGGNDAGIVLPDVDPKAVAGKIFTFAFMNSGQVCGALKRLYVHEDIYEGMCEALTEIARSKTTGPGDEADFGPLQNKSQLDYVTELAEDAKAAGARILCGGEPMAGPGYFFPTTLVADITDGTRLVDEEPFGPILPIIRYSDIDDAIARANDNVNGLGGSIWTNDEAKGVELAGRLESGTAWVNQHCAIQPDVPFGGAKQSGYGVGFGVEGLLEYTRIQVVNLSKV